MWKKEKCDPVFIFFTYKRNTRNSCTGCPNLLIFPGLCGNIKDRSLPFSRHRPTFRWCRQLFHIFSKIWAEDIFSVGHPVYCSLLY